MPIIKSPTYQYMKPGLHWCQNSTTFHDFCTKMRAFLASIKMALSVCQHLVDLLFLLYYKKNLKQIHPLAMILEPSKTAKCLNATFLMTVTICIDFYWFPFVFTLQINTFLPKSTFRTLNLKFTKFLKTDFYNFGFKSCVRCWSFFLSNLPWRFRILARKARIFVKYCWILPLT